MPFKSDQQRRFLWENRPEIASKWSKEYPDQGKLPQYVDDKPKEEAFNKLRSFLKAKR